MEQVFVGLSGGVDSAVAAYLLKKKGYAVTGVFIKGWEPNFLPCTGADDRLSAMRVAAHLGIPFKTYDLSEEYKREVVDYFVSEYKAGKTPNPDVVCNRAIKFGAFWDAASRDGATHIATGHYAQTNGTELIESVDQEKDQTYFLWTLTADDLAHSLFPIGEFNKKQVRSMAREAGLPNAARKDSQGLCFLGHVDMHDFLARYIPTQKGSVYDEAGALIGEHDGAWFYTLGQRLPIQVHSAHKWFVVRKDIRSNELVVSQTPQPEQAEALYSLSRVSWVSGIHPTGNLVAQFRYHGPKIPVVIRENRIKFQDPVLAAPGQSVVVYDAHGTCMGGGIIE